MEYAIMFKKMLKKNKKIYRNLILSRFIWIVFKVFLIYVIISIYISLFIYNIW